MSQYFKRLAARCKPSLSAATSVNGRGSENIEAHEETVAPAVFTPPKILADLPAPRNHQSEPVTIVSENVEATGDQPQAVINNTKKPPEIETIESVSEVTLPPENTEVINQITVNEQPDVRVENIHLQENTTTLVNHQPVQVERQQKEIHQKERQIIKQSDESVTRETIVESQLSEPEPATMIRSVEGTAIKKTPSVKLVEEKRSERNSPAPVQSQSPALVKEKPIISKPAEKQVNIKIGKIDLDVYQPQPTVQTAPPKSVPRASRKLNQSNHLSRYYLRGGLG